MIPASEATTAMLLAMVGRADESVSEARSAVKRDPVSPQCRFVLAGVFVAARRFEEAIAEANVSIELDPGSTPSHVALGRALVGLGRPDEAVHAFRRWVSVTPADTFPQAWLGWALGLAGQREESLEILADLERHRSRAYVGGVLLACVNLGLGDHDRAISWLQQAAEERDGLMPWLDTLLAFDPLRSDPRFHALLKKMNFPTSADQPSSA